MGFPPRVLYVLHLYDLTPERTLFQAYQTKQSPPQTPSQEKIRALCETNTPVIVPIRLVMALKASG